MEDFRLFIDSDQKQFVLTDYDENNYVLDYDYAEKTGILTIHAAEIGWQFEAKALPWKNLPLVSPLFHWTVDSVH